MPSRESASNDNSAHRPATVRSASLRCWQSWLVMSVIAAVLAMLGMWLWPDDIIHYARVVAVSVWFFGPAYFQLPLFVLGSIAVVIFAIGSLLRWPSAIARWSPWWRGMALLLVVFVLHGAWFQFGWVPFRPLCLSSCGLSGWNSHRALIGPLTSETAQSFVDGLNGPHYDVARWSGPDGVVVRPAIALFENEINWNHTTKVAHRVAMDHGLPLPDDNASDRCSEVEPLLMAGGRAESRGVGWGYWPWNTFGDGALVRWLRGLYQDG